MSENCLICKKSFTNPVIAMNGNVYCRRCITMWNSKNDKDPVGIQKDTKWITCPLFDRLYVSLQVITDLNLLKLIDIPEFECESKEDARVIMDMIDNEYHEQEKRIDKNEVFKKIILTKIFVNSMLINSIINFLADTWIGKNKMNVQYYVFKYGTVESIQHMIKMKNINFFGEKIKELLPLHEIVGKSRFDQHNSHKIIKLLDSLSDYINLGNNIHCVFNNQNCFTSSDQLKAIELIISKNTKETLEIVDEKIMAPIHYLCSNMHNMSSSDQVNAINMLIKCNVSLNQADIEGKKPINYALNSGADIVKTLMNHGVEINTVSIDDILNSPVFTIGPKDRLGIAKILVDGGFVNDQNYQQNLRIMNSVCGINNYLGELQFEFFKLFFSFFVKILQSGETTNYVHYVHSLCSSRNNFKSHEQLEVIKLLISNNVSLSEPNGTEFLPEHYICGIQNKLTKPGDQLEAIKLLLSYGIKFSKTYDGSATAMHMICSTANYLNSAGQLECINLMIKHGVDFEKPNRRSWRGIQYVCCKFNKMESSDQLEAIKQMVKHGVDINTKDDSKITPLQDVASSCNNLNKKDQIEAIKFLINNGADINVCTSSGGYALENILDQMDMIEIENLIKNLVAKGDHNRVIIHKCVLNMSDSIKKDLILRYHNLN